MIDVLRVGHATFTTPDLERQVDYYSDVLGLIVTERDKNRAFLATRTGLEAIALERGDKPELTRLSFRVAADAENLQIDAAGIAIYAYNYSPNASFSDPEIERGFEMTKALGADIITASTTLDVAKRIAPFAEKHKMMIGFHGHDNTADPNETGSLESYAQALSYGKYNGVNLDIGYLSRLGPPALPALDRARLLPNVTIPLCARNQLMAIQVADMASWRSWGFRSWRLQRWLDKHPDQPSGAG